MATAITPRAEGATRVAHGLDRFFAAVKDTNPFAANRVTEPSAYDVDVPTIHGDGFDRLVRLAGEAMRAPSGIGVALLGGAGVGKSHLLSRLYRWANEPAPGGGPRACYVYLHNILADPDRLPRYLLKYVVSRLSEGGRGRLFRTPLFGFLDRAIRHAFGSAGAEPSQTTGVLEAYRAHFETSLEGRDVYEVLFQFYRHSRPERADDAGRRRLACEALAWLSGDEIDPDIAQSFGLKVDATAPAMLRDDQQVEQVLLALARMAFVSHQPLILCVDQVDNLDPDKLKSLAQFLHALLDHASNLLVITSGVKQTLLGYKADNVIPEATWDRIAERAVELRRITRAEGRQILEARMERFLDPFLELDEVRLRLHKDSLFPLGVAWFEQRLADGLEFRARDVLSWSRDAWEDEQQRMSRLGGGAWVKTWPLSTGEVIAPPPVSRIEDLIDAVVDRKIEEQIAQHRLQPGSLPPDAGNLAGLVESLLGRCSGGCLPYTFRGIERTARKKGKLPPYDLLVSERREPDEREVKSGVSFVTNVGPSATASLRRLLDEASAVDHRILVTDQERRPLKVGAQGAEYYRSLEKLGARRFEHIKLDFEQYARLDALQGVIGMARSGDLEIESPRGTVRPVSEAEVIASHHRRDRFRQHPLLRPLLTEEPLPDGPRDPETWVLFEVDHARQYIMAQLAWRMGSTAEALAKGFLEELAEPRPTAEDVWTEFKEIAGGMHAEGLIHATPQDNDLFLLLRK
jgi:AAA ATPase domain